MEETERELRERYESLETDALVSLYLYGRLTQPALSVLSEVLKARREVLKARHVNAKDFQKHRERTSPNRKEVGPLYAEIRTVPKGYQFRDRIFENRKDAEDYVRFWHGLQRDWKSSKTPTLLCPRCGGDKTEEVLPWDEKVIPGIIAVVIFFTFVLGLGREFIYLFIAISLAFMAALSGPSRYRCKACEHRFLYPPVYKDDLPSKSVPKGQYSPTTPQADSPQTQAKSSERLQTILLVTFLVVIVFGMLSILANSGTSSSDHPSELELPAPLGALQHTWQSAREKRALEAAARRGNVEAAWQLYAYADRGAEADAWLCLAANGSHPDAQNEVARRYWYVKGDRVRGYMWYLLAAANGSKSAAVEAEDLRRELTAEQIANAKRLAIAWKPAPESCGLQSG